MPSFIYWKYSDFFTSYFPLPFQFLLWKIFSQMDSNMKHYIRCMCTCRIFLVCPVGSVQFLRWASFYTRLVMLINRFIYSDLPRLRPRRPLPVHKVRKWDPFSTFFHVKPLCC